MFKKKTSIVVLSFMIAAMSMMGCGTESTGSTSEKSTNTSATEVNTAEETVDKSDETISEPFSVVCTIFPEYDWVKEILGDHAENVELTYLLDSGVDLHSFQPTADDIMKISTCDLFIYVGGESDEWVEDALDEATNKDMKVINLMDILGDSAKVEELKEGMQDDEHDHNHEKKEVTEDRTLADYEGEWQSVYPFMNDKFKEETVSYMAEAEGFDDEDEAWDFFYKGNETDVRYVNIKGNNIEFVKEDGSKTSGKYEYDGFYSDCWGETSIRYQFKNTDSSSEAPKYVQFDDHLNYSTKAEHFHIYCGDNGTEMLDIKYNWPTYYPADIKSEDEMIHEFLKHYITDEGEDEHEDGEEEYDEHVWLSLKNAKVLCAEIENNIAAIDPANSADYKANLDSYVAKLSELDNSFQTLVDSSSVKTLVFGDRFPFRYFVDDYGLDYYAAFIGCSAETEASFQTIAFLADKVAELDCKTIFTLENSSKDIANTIISASGKSVDIAELNSLQSVSKDDISSGATYLSLMQKNYDVLSAVLK